MVDAKRNLKPLISLVLTRRPVYVLTIEISRFGVRGQGQRRRRRPRGLRELPPRGPQVALQAGKGARRVSGVQGLRADQEQLDYSV